MSRQDFTNVLEERQFTNPHVRFRRIRGRIVPIYNKKKIGEQVEGAGKKIRKAGFLGLAAAAGTKMIKRTSAFKRMPKFSVPSIPKGPVTGSLPVRSFKRIGRGSFNAALAVAKRPGRVGAALAVIGTGAIIAGTNLQLNSRFGKDL